MKVAITADVHLGIGEDHPERYNVLRNILEQMSAKNLDSLIIAGDLFHENFQNYSEFERLCRDFPAIHMHIIPGNHDQNISEQNIVGENINVYTEPHLETFDTTQFLFIPYVEGAKMGQKITEMVNVIGDERGSLSRMATTIAAEG